MRRLFTLALLLSPAAAVAQPAAPRTAADSAVATARAFFDAIAAERWRDAARRLDLVTLDAMRRETVGRIRSELREPPPTVQALAESFMDTDSLLPRPVAELQAKQMQAMLEHAGNRHSFEYADVANPDSLAALSSADAGARWIEAHDGRYAARRMLADVRARGCVAHDELLAAATADATRPITLLGAMVKDSSAYVLYRQEPPGSAEPDDATDVSYESAPDVMILRRRRGLWLVDPAVIPSPFTGSMGFAIGDLDPDCPPKR